MAISWLIRRFSGPPAFRIYGKTRGETDWRIINVYTTPRRNCDSRWPLWRGKCITWGADVIAVGTDFAAALLADPAVHAASRDKTISVYGGRFMNVKERLDAGFTCRTEREILAHEIGHAGQAQRLGFLYFPLVGSVTLFGEGRHWWNHFENDASEQGLFGGIVQDE